MCVRAGGLMLRKQITKKIKGAEKTIRVSRMATVMQARKPTVDLAALEAMATWEVERTQYVTSELHESVFNRLKCVW